MITVFSAQPSARLNYTVNLLFSHVLNTDFRIISDEKEFSESGGFRINYSYRDIKADLHWRPHEMMESKTVDHVEVEVRNWKDMPTIFPQMEHEWPFDLFAATFFLASRYEEYLPHNPDRHVRFTAAESTAYQNGFLRRPVINEWAQRLQKYITGKYREIRFSQKPFRAEATFDIDVAWAYKNKGWWRTIAAFGMDKVKLNFAQFKERWQVVFGGKADPYDTYSYIREQTDRHQIAARYFFLLGDYSSFDRNSRADLPAMQQLVRECADHGVVGIHPSYRSHKSIDALSKEIKRLRDILKTEVTDSRQHYLKMTMPDTYQRLIDCGIRKDFTMGYAEQVGFRASLCTPFPFFDLSNNVETALWVCPFAFMDGTFQHYLELEVGAAKEIIRQLIDVVYDVDGQFICLWHNSSLSERNEWKGWRAVFEDTLQYCADREAGAKLR